MPHPRFEDKPKPSAEDIKQAAITEAIVAKGIETLRPWVKSGPRMLSSLTKAEIEHFAWAVIGAFIEKRKQLEVADELNDPLPPNMLGH